MNLLVSTEPDSPGIALSSTAGRCIVLACVLGSGLGGIDTTVVNIALPAIGRDLHVGFVHAEGRIDFAGSLLGVIALGGITAGAIAAADHGIASPLVSIPVTIGVLGLVAFVPAERCVLPAVTVYGLGLAVFVAPLTSTVLAAVPVECAGVASGTNNSIFRAAGVISIAALPAITGLTGDTHQSASRFLGPFRDAIWICVGLHLVGALLSALTIRNERHRAVVLAGVPAPAPQTFAVRLRRSRGPVTG